MRTAPSDGPASMDDQAWHRFLGLLAPERDRAAALYVALRRKLIDLFRWRGLASADELADETIERAVRRVGAGEEIRSLPSYVCGIAQRLALEAARREARHAPLADDRSAAATAADGDRLDSLDQCLDRLPPAARALVLRYYASGDRIADRRKLADELGIGLNALRIRVHRLRSMLETCLGSSEAA